MVFQLQLVVQADLPEIVSIYNSTVAGRSVTADLVEVTVSERQAWFDAHKANRPLYVVKDEADRVIGWGGFSDYYSRAAYSVTAEISIYLHPEARGRGLGKKLAEAMVARAPELGIRNVIGVVFAHNEPSLKLFRNLGFEQWGLLPGVCDLDGTSADVVLLGKRL